MADRSGSRSTAAVPMSAPDTSRPRFLTPAEVADELRVSAMTVYRLIHSGELGAVRIGRSFRVSSRDLEHFIECRRSDGSLPQVPEGA